MKQGSIQANKTSNPVNIVYFEFERFMTYNKICSMEAKIGTKISYTNLKEVGDMYFCELLVEFCQHFESVWNSIAKEKQEQVKSTIKGRVVSFIRDWLDMNADATTDEQAEEIFVF